LKTSTESNEEETSSTIATYTLGVVVPKRGASVKKKVKAG